MLHAGAPLGPLRHPSDGGQFLANIYQRHVVPCESQKNLERTSAACPPGKAARHRDDYARGGGLFRR